MGVGWCPFVDGPTGLESERLPPHPRHSERLGRPGPRTTIRPEEGERLATEQPATALAQSSALLFSALPASTALTVIVAEKPSHTKGMAGGERGRRGREGCGKEREKKIIIEREEIRRVRGNSKNIERSERVKDREE